MDSPFGHFANTTNRRDKPIVFSNTNFALNQLSVRFIGGGETL